MGELRERSYRHLAVPALLAAAVLLVFYAARRLPSPSPAFVPVAAPAQAVFPPASPESGKLPPAAPVPAREEGLRRALLKYGDRPVVKELLEDLERHPEAAKALSEADPGEPLKALEKLRAVPGGSALAAKYLTRPDFLALLAELRKDPDLNSGDSMHN
ncbi:MAG: hypothetical protein FD189_2018 [Elusimicrobia bacterium]|nr:MAG: hypothetical protein FD154_2118 [Elusimicrobiota bacterium]KAF0154204.1 MAG: hypothetical protein FD189_2018 [Elusimicrobiota bacterium]